MVVIYHFSIWLGDRSGILQYLFQERNIEKVIDSIDIDAYICWCWALVLWHDAWFLFGLQFYFVFFHRVQMYLWYIDYCRPVPRFNGARVITNTGLLFIEFIIFRCLSQFIKCLLCMFTLSQYKILFWVRLTTFFSFF